MKSYRPCRKLALAASAVAFLAAAFSPPTLAQPGQGQQVLIAYVDPVLGVDGTQSINNVNDPYRTINHAISVVDCALYDLRVMGIERDGLVRCLPGIYSHATNGETLPIRMKRRVQVQGIGAKECVIRGRDLSNNVAWFPYAGFGGAYTSTEILVDFSGLNNGSDLDDDLDTMIDRFTFQGGGVQVYCNPEVLTYGRVSNCVFDMRDDGQGNVTTEFGVLIVSTYFGEPNAYNPVHMNILNNTFIQGWLLPDGTTETAVASNVAICETNNPVPFGAGNDPDTRLRGVNELNVQNNLIRQLPAHQRTSFLGVEHAEVSAATGTTLGLTNAFDSTSAGDVSVDGTYTSIVVSAAYPQAKVEINTPLGPIVDAGFVGEMIGDRGNGDPGDPFDLQNPDLRDWRILPDSLLVDQGTSPINSLLISANGTRYRDRAGFTSSFEADGDGHGNPRTFGSETDIGFDETSTLVTAGCYGNDSKSHNIPWDSSIEPGNPERIHIFPTPSFFLLRWTGVLKVGHPAYLISPGSVPGNSSNLGIDYLDPSILNTGAAFNANWDSWVNPVDGRTYNFALRAFTFAEGPSPTIPVEYHNEQFLYMYNGSIVLTNLQSEIL